MSLEKADPVLKERAQKIKLLILDVDGVLTDGRIIYGDAGDELKCFDVQDGLGIYLLSKVGIQTVIITAKKSPVVRRRARDSHIAKVYQNAPDKWKAYQKVRKKFRVTDEEVCFIGDDLLDLPILLQAGLAVSVPNAVAEVRSRSHYITQREGGRGAVREVVDFILKSQEKYEALISHYTNHQ
ncbi:HAD hydrolase family protein [candidate division TA06 bacterium]|nr:HAD hydrolase family protein [candidate division TA06 bacterium]